MDNEGNSYVSGTFLGMANFDGFTLIDENNTNIYIAKFNKNGDFLEKLN